MGQQGLNPGVMDDESDPNPARTLTIRRFLLDCLTLADPADQGFSPLCATTCTRTFSLIGLLSRPAWSGRRHPHDGMEPRLAGGGIWKLTAPRAEDAVHVRVFHDDGGCYGVMMKMPFGAHPDAVIEGGHKPFGNRHRASSRIPPRRPCPDMSRWRSRRMSRAPWNFGGGPMIIRLRSRFHHDGRHRPSVRRHAVRGRLAVLVGASGR